MPVYWDYLHLDQLLGSQGGLEGDESQISADELHFIVVHQVFELWFKLVLRELRMARDELAAPRVPEEKVPHFVHHLRRCNEILRLCADQFRIVETLTPQDFLAFRDKLIPASGFQSFQMRELELLLGLEDRDRMTEGDLKPFEAIKALAERSKGGEAAWKRIEAARAERSLREVLHEWLFRTPIQGSSPGDDGDAEAVQTFLEEYLAATERHQTAQLDHFARVPGANPETTRQRLDKNLEMARSFLFAEDVAEGDRQRVRRIRAGLVFIESYRKLPLMAWPRLLIDMAVELEENMVLFRSRHARMVERVIGRRIGTGGSSGVDYLDATAKYRVFTELWTVRTLLLPREALPDLRQPEFYGFAT